MQRVAAKSSDVRGAQFQTGRHLDLPPVYLMMFRVLGSLSGILAQLDATIPYARIIGDWVPGFREDEDRMPVAPGAFGLNCTR